MQSLLNISKGSGLPTLLWTQSPCTMSPLPCSLPPLPTSPQASSSLSREGGTLAPSQAREAASGAALSRTWLFRKATALLNERRVAPLTIL